MKSLIAHIQNRVRVSPELAESIGLLFKKEQVAKGGLLLKDGSHVRKLYFVSEGMFRTYYLYDGKEITSWFYSKDQFLTSWYGFYKQQVSYEYIEALEDCTVYAIEYSDYIKLIDDFQQFERFSRLLAEEQLAFIDVFSKGYMLMSARDRYKSLLTIIPDIELRVKLGYIASFLGISQETLSRVRSQKSTF